MSLTPLYFEFRQRKAVTPSQPPEQLVYDAARLDEERKQLARERAAFEAARDERLEHQRTEQRRAEALAIAADLGRAIDIDRPRYVASLISKAAAKGRGEVAELPLTGLAAQIVFQGKVRRGEVVADAVMLPPNPVARAVVLSAKRARGEATADEESWLSHFLKGIEC